MNSKFKSLRQCDLSCCTKRQIKDYFMNTHNLNELLFSSIIDKQYLYNCPDRLRLPLLFYLPHPSSVYINKLLLAGLITERVDSHFEKLFETGVDEMSWDDTENYRMGGSFRWPTLPEVMNYRDKVKGVVNDVIDSTLLQLPITPDSPWWAVFMGLEHERCHIETSSVLIRQLPVNMVKRPDNWTYAPTFAGVSAGNVNMGKPKYFPSYGWDNEYGQYQTEVPEFEASQYLVSNKEFLEFVSDRGYSRPELWSQEGWQWREFRAANHPTFWVCEEGCKSACGAELTSHSHCTPANGTSHEKGSDKTLHSKTTMYRYRAMFDVIDLPLYWPVDVNYHEAKAYCTWKGSEYRLPTEAEHHRMRGQEIALCDVSCDPSSFDDQFPANCNLKYGSSTPVNMYPPSSMGFYDVYGNVWEWTEDHFNGLPGFKSSYLYDDYSTPSFDGKHNMIMGGSWISTGHQASRFTRYTFRRHFIQHAGFRLVRSSGPTPMRMCNAEVFVLGARLSDNPITAPRVDLAKASSQTLNDQFQFETETKLQEQLAMEYGSQENSVSLVEFVERTVKEEGFVTTNAIQFGCGTGLNSFLLTRIFDKLTAVDYCGRFIDAALRVQSGETVQYGEGKTAILPARAKPGSVKFVQLTWIPNEIEGYSVVVFEFIDRLNEPRGWLLKLWEVVVSGGLVIFITAPTSNWDRATIGSIIGNRFDLLLKTVTVGDRTGFVWKRKL